MAISNFAGSPAAITTKIYDDTGALLQTATVNLAACGHTAFLLPDTSTTTAAKRGMVEFVVPQTGKISAIVLRAKADGTLTTIPVLSR